MSDNKYKKGIYNNYPARTKIFEVVLKDINHLIESIYFFFANGFKAKRIFIYPELPRRRTSFFKISKRLHFSISNKLKSNILLAVHWENTTVREKKEILEKVAINNTVINKKCLDIGKTYVDKAFHDTFGYSTTVDPKTYNGKCLKKNELNAKHDGVEVNCPIVDPDENYIYQIIINNFVDDEFVADIRVPIVKHCLSFAYIKEKKKAVRYESNLFRSRLVEIETVLSTNEIEKLNDFCLKIGLDYGELDVLRNNDDGKIYVIDVNNTAFGPAQKLSKEKNEFALHETEQKFIEHFLT